MIISFLTFFCGFLLGVMSLAALQLLGAYILLQRLSRKSKSQETLVSSNFKSTEFDQQESLNYFSEKKGFVWILESDKIMADQEPKKKKNGIIEVTTIKKLANLNGGSLILTDDHDDSVMTVSLTGCEVSAVSSGTIASKKWAKKFPIKIESKSSAIYNTSKTICIFAETSWEKESWCKALRFAASENKQKKHWFVNSYKEFQAYVTSLNVGYPSFLKPSAGFLIPTDGPTTSEDSTSSKVRLFLKKLAKKAPKSNLDYGVHELTNKLSSSSELSSRLLSIASHYPPPSEADCDDTITPEEGTLCWNLLASRLFFDAKSNADIVLFFKNRIQRSLSNMRTPTYIGEIICSEVEIGSLPPYISAMRVHPMDLNEVWSWEVDLQYAGGVILHIETRLDVHDQDLQKEMEGDESSEPFDVLEQINLSNDAESPVTEHVPRWKTFINSVAKQVSQVPLSLALRVTSLKGTMRFQIKPPPSDQIWFAFTSPPDIEIRLETSVGERKISNVHVGAFLANRLKQSIRESMVVPNCESVTVPWMVGEKEDWSPVSSAPFMFVNEQEKPKPQKSGSLEIVTRGSKSIEELKAPLIAGEKAVNQEEEEMPKALESTSDEELKPKKVGTRARMIGLGKKMGEKFEEKRRHLEEKRRLLEEKSRTIVDKMRN